MSTQKEQVEEAVSLLSDDKKAAFLEASKNAPELVLIESNPEAFLRCEKGNVQKAALRLASYWTERKSLFNERAFLPMNPSGDGALMKDDIEMLESGLMVALPPDKAGHPVMFHDSSRMSLCIANEKSRHRVRFYFLNRLAMDLSKEDEGVVIMRMMGLNTPGKAVGSIRKQVEDCLPMNIHSLHFCCVESNPEAQKHILCTVIPVVAQGLGKKLSSKMKVHIGKDPAEVFEKLERCGFERTAVPSTVGGSWSYAALDAWRLRKSENGPLADSESPSEPRPLEAVPPIFQFILGVLVMLQEQKRSSLATLLQDTRTQQILKGLLRPRPAKAVSLVEGTPPKQTPKQPPKESPKQGRKTSPLRKRKRAQVSTEDDETVRKRIATLREENKRLALEIRGRLPTGLVTPPSEETSLTSRVQFALGVLASLEEKQECNLRSLLSDVRVQRILSGLLGSVGTAVG